MSAVFPQAGGVEAEIEGLRGVASRGFGGLLVFRFGEVEVPLLLVGEEGAGDEEGEERGDGDVDGGEGCERGL